jgi:GMP synthase (glutamine-hydrolysing)
MLPCTFKVSELKWKPKGIILSGSPYSVYEADSPRVDPQVFELGVPVFGICYGLQEISRSFGGKVIACDHKEYGSAILDVCKPETLEGRKNLLFDGLGTQVQVGTSIMLTGRLKTFFPLLCPNLLVIHKHLIKKTPSKGLDVSR